MGKGPGYPRQNPPVSRTRTISSANDRRLGGCSSTNATVALRGHPADYDAWARAGNDGWSFGEVLPFFTRLEDDADFGQAAWHGEGGPLPIRRHRDDEFTDVAQAA